MAGVASLYTTADVVPTLLLLGFLVLLNLVRFTLPWLERKNGGFWTKNIDFFLRKCSKFYLSSNRLFTRELGTEDACSSGESVSPNVYRSVGLYAIIVPACASLISLKTWFLQESLICNDSLSCFTTTGSSFFDGKDISSCSSVKASDTVVCYRVALNCVIGLVHIGGLIVALESCVRATSVFFQMFHDRYAKVLRRILLVSSSFLCVAASAGLAVGNVVSLSEALKLFTLSLCFVHALTIPWEELYTSSTDKQKDEPILDSIQNKDTTDNKDEEKFESHSSELTDSKELLVKEEHNEDEEKPEIVDDEEVPKLEKDDEIDGSTANQSFDDTTGNSITIQVTREVDDQDDVNNGLLKEDDRESSATYKEESSSDSNSLLIPEEGSSASAGGGNITARKRKVQKLNSIETTV